MKAILKQHEEHKRELEQLNDHWENSARYLEYTKQELEERLYHAEESAILIKEELDEISIQKEIEIQRLKDEIKDLRQEISFLSSSQVNNHRVKELEDALNKAMREQMEFKEKLRIAKEQSEGGNGEVTEVTTTVRVIVKVRPFLDSDPAGPQCLMCNDTEVQIESKKVGSAKCFMFEKVIGPDDSIDELFMDLESNIVHAANGGNSCILAYGQTGSGKTYTMNGVISRSLNKLKQRFDCESVMISLQIIEIYNEQVKNLLTNDPLSRDWKDILNLSEIQLGNNWVSKAQDLIKKSCHKRQTKSTDSN
ncbi:hypothetical protein SteCoe_14959 [Stentor coeruleus]|uniref:Kinesin motor domain-containing protein n=1 Tax=Stentor coeruleus TaxID=5963 RepID=A0A1R2C4S8_9CILI|nr:hypothetical protein SteCoe_14959 [Stentor coeruleus]